MKPVSHNIPQQPVRFGNSPFFKGQTCYQVRTASGERDTVTIRFSGQPEEPKNSQESLTIQDVIRFMRQESNKGDIQKEDIRVVNYLLSGWGHAARINRVDKEKMTLGVDGHGPYQLKNGHKPLTFETRGLHFNSGIRAQ